MDINNIKCGNASARRASWRDAAAESMDLSLIIVCYFATNVKVYVFIIGKHKVTAKLGYRSFV